MKEKLFKVILIGDATVGKTSCVNKYVYHKHTRDYKGTIGGNIIIVIYTYNCL